MTGTFMHRFLPLILSFFTMVALLGCDSVEPTQDDLLVVEGFLNAGAPFPPIKLSTALALSDLTQNQQQALEDVQVKMLVDDQLVRYGPSEEVGQYLPIDNLLDVVPANAEFKAEIQWQGQTATVEDMIPPPIVIEYVEIDVPQSPVTAILVDTLRFDSPEVGARQGYIYAIDVTMRWSPAVPIAEDSTFWIETRLIPQSDFSSTVLDVFLLTEEVRLESAFASSSNAPQMTWSGVYAIPVADSLAPPPEHNVTIQLIRSTQAYADFAASRHTPERREPVSNIDGAIGVLAGIALDSIEFEVKDGVATKRQVH